MRALMQTIATILVAGASVASAQSLVNSPVIFSSGVWDVHRTTDAMTDATVCTAIYKSQFGVQLGENMLTIAVADGVKSVRLRFDDEEAQAVRPATHSEFDNNRIEVSGSDFAELLDSRHMRYEATTATNTLVSGDIDLDGVFQAHDNVRAGCAGSPTAKSNLKAPADECTPGLRERMSRKGVAAQDIEDICNGAAAQ